MTSLAPETSLGQLVADHPNLARVSGANARQPSATMIADLPRKPSPSNQKSNASVAGDRLANSSDPVSFIARALGYESESAFSTAFKRVMGRPPRQYGRGPARASRKSVKRDAAGAKRLESVAG